MSTLDQQREVLTRVATLIRKRGLSTPAIFALESVRPLSFVASQALVVLGPLIQALLPLKDYDTFCEALERRENLDWLIDHLEANDDA